MKSFLFILLILLFFSCAQTTDNTGPAAGTLNAECFPNGTCNDGLVCKDSKCVKEENKDLCKEVNCDMENTICDKETGKCVCDSGFHLEEEKCIGNKKVVGCVKPDINNSEYEASDVEIKWLDEENKWEEIPVCQWYCKDGYFKKKDADGKYVCETCSCEDWEECNPENGDCTLKEGKCKSENDCQNGYICDVNHNCVNEENPCENVDCGGHGVCVENENIAFCDCEEGYFDDGSLNCIDPCENVTCSNHGTCLATTILDITCNCDENYFPDGLNCISPCTGHWNCSVSDERELPDDERTISPIDPQNLGRCVAIDINTAECICIDGYQDDDNDLVCSSICAGITCGGHGTCYVNDSNEAVCNCHDGYVNQPGNALNCVDIDECISNLDNCDDNATCTNTEGGFDCECNDGYSGDGITCTPVDPCNNQCEDYETCNNGICEPVLGRCNTSADCNKPGACFEKSGGIDPNITDCACNFNTHYCEATGCNPPCEYNEICVGGVCEPR